MLSSAKQKKSLFSLLSFPFLLVLLSFSLRIQPNHSLFFCFQFLYEFNQTIELSLLQSPPLPPFSSSPSPTQATAPACSAATWPPSYAAVSSASPPPPSYTTATTYPYSSGSYPGSDGESDKLTEGEGVVEEVDDVLDDGFIHDGRPEGGTVVAVDPTDLRTEPRAPEQPSLATQSPHTESTTTTMWRWKPESSHCRALGCRKKRSRGWVVVVGSTAERTRRRK